MNNWLPVPLCDHGSAAKQIIDEKLLFKVDVTLHLFPNIDATNIWIRRLLRVYKKVHSSGIDDGPCEAMSEIIPILYVRQGRDDAACDFIYRHFFQNLIPKNDNRPHAPLCFANFQASFDLGHQVLLTLITIKALRLFKDIENVSLALRGHVAQEIIDEISKHLGSDFLKAISGFDYLKATGNAAWRQEKILEMERVLVRCVYQASRRNRHIWSYVLDTERLSARELFGQYSSWEVNWNTNAEARAEIIAIRQYQVWMETPGSHDILRSAMAAAEAARWVPAGKLPWLLGHENEERWIDDRLAAQADGGLHECHACQDIYRAAQE